ncbi:MAG: GGDEF-domain containing protein, partial [Streptomyces sp.]
MQEIPGGHSPPDSRLPADGAGGRTGATAGAEDVPWLLRLAALRVPGLRMTVVTVAAIAAGAGVASVLTRGHALFPDAVRGWSLAVLTGIIVGHLVALGRD